MPKEREGRIENQRVKDAHSEHNHMVEGLSDDMKAFYAELSQIFPEIRITSGKRESSPSGKFSHHHEGNAIDIGKEHTDVYDYLVNDIKGLALMNKYGLGILDETHPENMKKTNATGPHFHIGKDSRLYATTKQRLEQYENIQPMQSFYSQNQTFDYNNPDDLSGANLNLTGTYKPQADVIMEGPGGEPFRLVVPNQQVAEVFKGELQKEQEKEEIKSQKQQESEHRKLLEQKQKEENAKIAQVVNTMNTIRQRDAESFERESTANKYAIPAPQQPMIAVQQGLPTLPSIFKMQ